MAIHESKNTHIETLISRPSDDIIYYAYACIVARNLDWRPQNIANADEIYHFVNKINFYEFNALINEKMGYQVLNAKQKWGILKNKFNSSISNQLKSSLLKNDAQTIFLIWEHAQRFQINNENSGSLIFRTFLGFNIYSDLNSCNSIFQWLHRFEIFLCELGIFSQWNISLINILNQRKKRLTALDDIETETHLKSIYGTLGRLIQKYDMRLVPPNYFNHFSIEDSVSILQAWLDYQTEQVRAIIQPKLQQAIKQLVFREKQKKADKVPINSHLPAETMDAFNKFRAERGLTKEEALNFLILNGLTK